MRYYLRVISWLLIVMCTVLAVLGLATFFGVTVPIDFFGLDLDQSSERTIWVGANAFLVILGVVGAVLTRRKRA